jgi:serine/threonine protein kinase
MGKDAYDYSIFRKEDLIGKGGFGYIFKGTRKHDLKPVAIKILKEESYMLDEEDSVNNLEEISIMKEHHHPFIVKIIDDFIDDRSRQCLVLELYCEGDFENYLKESSERLITEQNVLRFLANIIMVVQRLNSASIYHRDIKPQNFLIKTELNGRMYLHLSDFGFAKNKNP